MSKAPLMIDCPRCVYRMTGPVALRPLRTSGIVERFMQGKTNSTILDTCERCGGSGRIALSMEPSKAYKRTTLKLAKEHKADLREWLEQEKLLIYGKNPEEL